MSDENVKKKSRLSRLLSRFSQGFPRTGERVWFPEEREIGIVISCVSTGYGWYAPSIISILKESDCGDPKAYSDVSIKSAWKKGCRWEHRPPASGPDVVSQVMKKEGWTK